MEAKKILSANLLDIIFDDRNKAYGAYELRVTYPERIKKSLLFTFAAGLLAFGGAVMANSMKPEDPGRLEYKEVTLSNIDQEEKLPEPLPEPVRKPEPQVQTEKLTQFTVVEDNLADEPPPTQDDIAIAVIDDFKQSGIIDDGITEIKKIDLEKKIIDEDKNQNNDAPFTVVEIDAKFIGNWEKFLMKNLNANIPVDNGAPAGRYKVIIQFVVDKEGNVSDIKALTNYGYGMEQEAIRVLKRASKWEPAFQNNSHVKAYRMQPITFEVMEE